jgi:A/G-specific adenine glycosylase
MTALPADLALCLVQWQQACGRHSLPWQQSRDPYRVWLSEIMLQQTQVSTVLGYYARFLQRFPDVCSLADAPLDDVLALWSGLGYYSRARNLHRCAQAVRDCFAGQFPPTAVQLQTLPGIGRSTAAAIAAFCFGERVAILDGNVKRVLTRALGFGQDLSQAAHERTLWQLATELLPAAELAEPTASSAVTAISRYTQGLMDLGATVCTARNPACTACPLAGLCVARREGQPLAYPVKTRKLKRSSEAWWLLWAVNDDGAVWLVQRPAPGIWAGLYCLPIYPSRTELEAVLPTLHGHELQARPVQRHVLTHKDLHLHPVRLRIGRTAPKLLAELTTGAWFAPSQWPQLGLPTPIRKLLLGD